MFNRLHLQDKELCTVVQYCSVYSGKNIFCFCRNTKTIAFEEFRTFSNLHMPGRLTSMLSVTFHYCLTKKVVHC